MTPGRYRFSTACLSRATMIGFVAVSGAVVRLPAAPGRPERPRAREPERPVHVLAVDQLAPAQPRAQALAQHLDRRAAARLGPVHRRIGRAQERGSLMQVQLALADKGGDAGGGPARAAERRPLNSRGRKDNNLGGRGVPAVSHRGF